MKNKATHEGHCQVCTRMQKLPGGKLAKHGYHVLGGFFEGICFGSGHLPVEQDTTLVKESIGWAAQRWLETKAEALIWAHPAIEPVMWFDVYRPSRFRHDPKSGYHWERCELRIIEQNGFKTAQIKWDNEWHSGTTYSMYAKTEADLLAIATESHAKYIERRVQPKMRELNRYIKSQQWVIDTWHEQPLTPVKEVDPNRPKKVRRQSLMSRRFLR